jgi:hypothetical protein
MANGQDAGLLQEWGKLWAGQWSIQSATPSEGGTLAVANGSHTINWMNGGVALEAQCTAPADAATAASGGSRWVAVFDPVSGQIKQSGVSSDGSVDVAYIGKKGGQWGWKQTRNFPNGVTETNCATFIISNGGKTITQHVTERVLGGAVQPLEGYVPLANAPAPTLASVCNVLTKVG